MRSFSFILLFSFLFFSCKQKKSNQYYSNGNIKKEFKPRAGRAGYTVSFYNEDGSKKYDIEYSKDSLQDGSSIFYYENGRIKSKANFAKGIENGFFQSYHENGNRKVEVHLVRGKKEGKFKEYFEDGNLRTIQDCFDGKTTGAAIFYFRNGNLNQKQLRINGRLLCTTFYDSLLSGIETETDVKIFPTSLNVHVGHTPAFKLPEDVDVSGCKMSARFDLLDGAQLTGDSLAYVENGNIIYPINTNRPGEHELKGTGEADSANVKVKFPLTIKYKVLK